MTTACATPDTRPNDTVWAAFTSQLSVLHSDVGEIKNGMNEFREGMKELSAAVLKLALVEERQTQSMRAMDRAFILLEKLTERVDAVAARVGELEKAEPEQARVAEWVNRAVWAAAAAACAALAAKLGLMR